MFVLHLSFLTTVKSHTIEPSLRLEVYMYVKVSCAFLRFLGKPTVLFSRPCVLRIVIRLIKLRKKNRGRKRAVRRRIYSRSPENVI